MSSSPSFIEFVKALRPGWITPDRRALAGRLLNEAVENITNQVTSKIASSLSPLALVTDGWTNIRRESIMNFIVHTPKPYYHSSISTGVNSHTSVYIATEISRVIESLGVEKVGSVITDNASNMKAAWRILQAKYPHIITIGCCSHGTNLLLKDVLNHEWCME